MRTQEMMKQFMDSIRTKGKEYEKKQINLRKVNSIKLCLNCREFVTISMYGLNGLCDMCKQKVYTIKNN